MTSEDVAEKEYRLALPASRSNGLRADSYLMLDKIVAIPRARLSKRIGVLEKELVDEAYARLVYFLAD